MIGWSKGDQRGIVGVLVGLGALLATVLILGLPWLWSLIKPWLHAITA